MSVKTISLKKKAEKTSSPEVQSAPKDSYPSFSLYNDAPKEIANLPIGTVITAKIRLASKEHRMGDKDRYSAGFDVMSIDVPDKSKKVQSSNAQSWME